MPSVNGDAVAVDFRQKPKGTAKMEHLKLFNKAILECRNDPHNDKIWQKVNQEFQVISSLFLKKIVQ